MSNKMQFDVSMQMNICTNDNILNNDINVNNASDVNTSDNSFYFDKNELENVLERIFKFFLYQYTRHGECNLLRITVRGDFHFDIIRPEVQDLFVDLWEGTNRFTGHDLLNTTNRSEFDNIRLVAKGVFDKLWDYHNKHCSSSFKDYPCICHVQQRW